MRAATKESASAGGAAPRQLGSGPRARCPVDRLTGLLLGGVLRPAGVTTSYLRPSFVDVLTQLTEWRRSLGQTVTEHETNFADVVSALEPFEVPWTREVLFEYLEAVGIRADDEGFYGRGAVVVQTVDFTRVQLTAQQIREDLGW